MFYDIFLIQKLIKQFCLLWFLSGIVSVLHRQDSTIMPSQLDVNDRNHDNDREAVKYQSTYRLESHNPFKVDPVDKIVKTVMINKLEEISYEGAQSSKVCESVAAEIREQIKKLKFDRYKIVVTVSIVQKENQSLQASMGFLWDAERDNYSTFTYESGTFHAYCCVFGLYHE